MLVIADFDNFFFAVRDADLLKNMISDNSFGFIFTWEVTTSSDAKAQIPENELREEKILVSKEASLRPKYIFVKFGDRSCWNKFLFSVYRVVQTFYTAIYFYFTPFLA